MPANGTPEEPADRILRLKDKKDASTQEKIDTLRAAISDPSANGLSNDDVRKVQNSIISLEYLLSTDLI